MKHEVPPTNPQIAKRMLQENLQSREQAERVLLEAQAQGDEATANHCRFLIQRLNGAVERWEKIYEESQAYWGRAWAEIDEYRKG